MYCFIKEKNLYNSSMSFFFCCPFEHVIISRADLMLAFSGKIVSSNISLTHIHTQRSKHFKEKWALCRRALVGEPRNQRKVSPPSIGFMTHISWRIKIGHKLHSWECPCTWHFHGRSHFCGNVLLGISVWRKKNICCEFAHSYASKVVRAAGTTSVFRCHPAARTRGRARASSVELEGGVGTQVKHASWHVEHLTCVSLPHYRT